MIRGEEEVDMLVSQTPWKREGVVDVTERAGKTQGSGLEDTNGIRE